jgi:hypothetical protein
VVEEAPLIKRPAMKMVLELVLELEMVLELVLAHSLELPS